MFPLSKEHWCPYFLLMQQNCYRHAINDMRCTLKLSEILRWCCREEGKDDCKRIFLCVSVLMMDLHSWVFKIISSMMLTQISWHELACWCGNCETFRYECSAAEVYIENYQQRWQVIKLRFDELGKCSCALRHSYHFTCISYMYLSYSIYNVLTIFQLFLVISKPILLTYRIFSVRCIAHYLNCRAYMPNV